MTGVDYWLDNPILSLTVAVSAIIVIFLIRRYRNRFWPSIDRFCDRLVFGSAVVIMATAGLVYGYGRPRDGSLQQIAILNSAILQLQASRSQSPTIQAPVDFPFIDKERVQGLYNQIEPELVEAQRSVASGGSVSAKAGIKAEVAEVEAGASKHQESTSTYERLDFSPERQCIEVINYLLNSSQARYYTNDQKWISQMAANSFQYQLLQVQTGSGIAATKSGTQNQSVDSRGGDEKDAAERQLKKYQESYNVELVSLRA